MSKKIIILAGLAILTIIGVTLIRRNLDQPSIAAEPLPYRMELPQKIVAEPFSFAIIGDTKSFDTDKANDFGMAIASISKKNPDFDFVLGDLIESCDSTNQCNSLYNQWKKAMSPLLSKTYEVVGNHDRTGNKLSDKAWQLAFDLPTNGPEGFSEMVYSFDYANAHFVVLDSEKPKESEISAEQQAWLEKDLDQNQKPLVFVFFHQPAFPVGSKIGNSLDIHKKQRDALWKILDSHNVTAVFAGHEHIFSRRLIDRSVFPDAQNSIYQFVVGNTDAPLDDERPAEGIAQYYYMDHHFALVKVDDNQIIIELYRPDGNLIDSFSFDASK